MPFQRVTMIMNHKGEQKAGFSESWDFEGDQATVKAYIPTLLQNRVKIMSHDWQIVSYRMAEIILHVTGSTCKRRLRNALLCPNNMPIDGTINKDADLVFAALLIRVSVQQTDRITYREYMLRGIPDDWWLTDKGPNLAPGDIGRIKDFFISLKTNNARATKTNGPCTAVVGAPFIDHCVKRNAVRKIGRPFGLLRGRKFAHRETV